MAFVEMSDLEAWGMSGRKKRRKIPIGDNIVSDVVNAQVDAASDAAKSAGTGITGVVGRVTNFVTNFAKGIFGKKRKKRRRS